MRSLEGRESDSGSPIKMASKAASEKLRTVMMEITVDAKQRLNAFKSEDVEAVSRGVCPISNIDIKTGMREVIVATAGSMY